MARRVRRGGPSNVLPELLFLSAPGAVRRELLAELLRRAGRRGTEVHPQFHPVALWPERVGRRVECEGNLLTHHDQGWLVAEVGRRCNEFIEHRRARVAGCALGPLNVLLEELLLDLADLLPMICFSPNASLSIHDRVDEQKHQNNQHYICVTLEKTHFFNPPSFIIHPAIFLSTCEKTSCFF